MDSSSPIDQETALRYRAETQLLRAQFNGDFLCNTLVVLQSCLIGDKPKLERLQTVVTAMGDYYRFALAAGFGGTVALSEEWQAVQGFLTVQGIRYGEDFHVDCELTPEALNFPTPRILLQPIVDNAVKYGRKTAEAPYFVRVCASCPSKNVLQIEVSNNGTWYKNDPRIGGISVSLDNLRQRLAALYPGRKPRMTIDTKGGWVTVKVRLSRLKES